MSHHFLKSFPTTLPPQWDTDELPNHFTAGFEEQQGNEVWSSLDWLVPSPSTSGAAAARTSHPSGRNILVNTHFIPCRARSARAGKLVGRFYDEDGAPTEALRQAEAAIEEALKFQAESEDMKQQFPPCNSEWSSAGGTRFWCSTQSGGVSRAWAGVPRQLYRPGARGSHCVCVRTEGPPWGHPPSAQHPDRGDLDDPQLEEYEGCPPRAQQCLLRL
ncbi:PREDICTED: neuferricin [Chaetura pelagica]|uniref:neuferricin n=1 Tax=Chaetura pelagica TaxID=8897 RepID=UPI000523B328|nr:PREDICTED: neuferricin [Chaetura pelagica]